MNQHDLWNKMIGTTVTLIIILTVIIVTCQTVCSDDQPQPILCEINTWNKQPNGRIQGDDVSYNVILIKIPFRE